MRFKLLTMFCLLWYSTDLSAQQSDRDKILIEKRKVCDQIVATFSGKPEDLDALIKTGTEGIKLAADNDYENKFIFNQAAGVGYYYKQDFKNTKIHFEAAYEAATKAGLIEKSLKPLGNLLSIYHYMGLQSKADEAAQKLKQIVESTDTLKNKADIYYNLGLYNQQQKFYYGIALSNFLKSVELYKPVADTTTIQKRKLDYGIRLAMVAEIYLYMKQPNKALEYLNEASTYLGNSVIYDVAVYGKLIRANELTGNKKEALRSYNLLQKTVGDQPATYSELVSSNLSIANLALKERDYKGAKFYIDKADRQSKLDNKELLTSSVNVAYGDYYRKLGNYVEAIRYYKVAEPGALIYNKEQYADLLKSLTEVQIKAGSAKDAAHYFDKYVVISDSLSQSKISLNLAEMEARFQNDLKQQKIGVLNKDNQDKNAQLEQEKMTRWMLIGGAVLLFIALSSFYFNFRNKQKANVLLDQKNRQLDVINAQLNSANQTKARLFSIITHDLRSPVSQLFTFLKLQQSGPDLMTEEERQIHQQKLMQSSTKLLSTMEDLLGWSKSQMDSFALDMDELHIVDLFEEVAATMQAQADDKSIEIKISTIGTQILRSDQNLLVIALRNLLQNAINHSFTNSIIQLHSGINDQKKIYLSIVNHGAVISTKKIDELINNVDVTSKSSGYGLLIVKEMLAKLDAVLEINSNEQATTIQVVFS
jgi:signal transduction histidine kinase